MGHKVAWPMLPASLVVPSPSPLRLRLATTLYALALVVLGVVKGVSYLAQFYAIGLFAQRVGLSVRRALFEKVCGLSPGKVARLQSGDLLSRFTADVGNVELAANYTVGAYLRDSFQIVVLLGVNLMDLEFKTLVHSGYVDRVDASPAIDRRRGQPVAIQLWSLDENKTVVPP